MSEDQGNLLKNNNQDRERALQRSNRVFILQYSPERSKSKKQKKWDTVEPRKEKLSSFLSRKEMLSQNQPLEQFSHRKNIDRLTSLISRNRGSNYGGQSGCEKLVKVVDRILRAKNPKADALQALKKYTMLCSSANYQLFIQSKHQYNLKKANDAPLSPLARINEYQSIEESSPSHQSSQMSPKKSPFNSDLTFRKKPEDAPLHESIFRNFESPKKSYEPFKLASREYIPTAETLNSRIDMPVSPLQPMLAQCPLIHLALRNPPFKCGELNEKPLADLSLVKEIQFLHLYHLETDNCLTQSPEEENQCDFQKSLLQAIKITSKIQEKPAQLPTNIFNNGRNRLNFALPSAISPNHESRPTPQKCKVNINYISQARDTVKKVKKSNQVLNAKQIAERMLFGAKNNEPAAAEIKVEKEIAEPKIKKRVSSLPKITFTYSSREKDPKFEAQSPSSKCIPLSSTEKKIAEPLRAVLKFEPQRKIVKQQLQSTFGSTQIAANASNSRNSRFKSPQQHENSTKIAKTTRQAVNFNPFGNKIQGGGVPAPKIDNQYYGGFARQKPADAQQQLRHRMATQQPLLGSEVQYVGIEEQPRGCCWGKQGRSKSLNDRVLVGLQRSPF